MQVFVWTEVFNSSGKWTECTIIARSHEKRVFGFNEKLPYSSKAADPFCISMSYEIRVLVFPSPPQRLMLSVFDLNPSNRCMVVSKSYSHFRLRTDGCCRRPCHMLTWRLTIFFGEVSFRSSAPVLAGLLILLKSASSMFSFLDPAFGAVATNTWPHSWRCRFSPVSSFRSFTVLHLTRRSVIHFEFFFVRGGRSVARFSFVLHVNAQRLRHDSLMAVIRVTGRMMYYLLKMFPVPFCPFPCPSLGWKPSFTLEFTF